MSPEKRATKPILEHPLTLLLAGFFLTGVTGSWLASYHSQREWARQQQYLHDSSLIEQRTAVIEQLVRAVAEAGAAASDVATMGYWSWSSAERAAEIAQRRALWEESSRKWRVESRVLLQKVRILFPDSPVSEKLQEVVNTRRQLGQKVREFLETQRSEKASEDEKRLAQEINDLANSLDSETRALAEALSREVGRATRTAPSGRAALGLSTRGLP